VIRSLRPERSRWAVSWPCAAPTTRAACARLSPRAACDRGGASAPLLLGEQISARPCGSRLLPARSAVSTGYAAGPGQPPLRATRVDETVRSPCSVPLELCGSRLRFGEIFLEYCVEGERRQRHLDFQPFSLTPMPPCQPINSSMTACPFAVSFAPSSPAANLPGLEIVDAARYTSFGLTETTGYDLPPGGAKSEESAAGYWLGSLSAWCLNLKDQPRCSAVTRPGFWRSRRQSRLYSAAAAGAGVLALGQSLPCFDPFGRPA